MIFLLSHLVFFILLGSYLKIMPLWLVFVPFRDFKSSSKRCSKTLNYLNGTKKQSCDLNTREEVPVIRIGSLQCCVLASILLRVPMSLLFSLAPQRTKLKRSSTYLQSFIESMPGSLDLCHPKASSSLPPINKATKPLLSPSPKSKNNCYPPPLFSFLHRALHHLLHRVVVLLLVQLPLCLKIFLLISYQKIFFLRMQHLHPSPLSCRRSLLHCRRRSFCVQW